MRVYSIDFQSEKECYTNPNGSVVRVVVMNAETVRVIADDMLAAVSEANRIKEEKGYYGWTMMREGGALFRHQDWPNEA